MVDLVSKCLLPSSKRHDKQVNTLRSGISSGNLDCSGTPAGSSLRNDIGFPLVTMYLGKLEYGTVSRFRIVIFPRHWLTPLVLAANDRVN